MLTLKKKIQLTNVVNRYRSPFGLYHSKGDVIKKVNENAPPVYIKDPKFLDHILKKFYRKVAITDKGFSGESINANGKFRRFKFFPNGTSRSMAHIKGCCHDHKPCNHWLKLCGGDGARGWKYHVGGLASIEDFLVSSIGFCNSFDSSN